jgi:hypothetical protein
MGGIQGFVSRFFSGFSVPALQDFHFGCPIFQLAFHVPAFSGNPQRT